MFKIGQILTDWDVQNFVRKIHYNSNDFIEGDIRERIEKFDHYEVKNILIDSLDIGSYYIDEEMVQEFTLLDNSTIPPIVLGEIYSGKYDVVDGNHRVESASFNGITTLLAFVPIISS